LPIWLQTGRIMTLPCEGRFAGYSVTFQMARKIPIASLVIPALLLVIAAVSLYVRIALPYNSVFTPDIIKFTGADAYYYMRLVDNIVYNFPHLTPFDPYFVYPGGANTGGAPDLFAYLIAFVAWLSTGGHFSQQGIDTVAVYIPPVLATLAIIPVYFIGKDLFNRWVGLLSAAIFVVLPGEIGRSLLGYNDQHIAEVLITTVLMMFLVKALKSGNGLDAGKPLNSRMKTLKWPLIYSICAGTCLGIYFLTWTGALLFVLLLFIYFLVQFTADHSRGKPVEYLGLAGFVTGAVALAMVVALRFQTLGFVSLLIFTLFSIVMTALSKYMQARGWKAGYFPATVAFLGLVSAAIIYAISPATFTAMVQAPGQIFIPQLATTNMEMQPLLFTLGRFTWDAIFESFTTAFYLSLIGICIVVYHAIRKGESDKVLLVVWSVIALLVTLSMRRFAYYYAVNAALLVGYLCWLALHLAGFGRAGVPSPAVAEQPLSKKAKRRQAAAGRKRTGPSPALAYRVLSIAGIFFLVFYPNFGPLPGGAKPISDMASQPSFAPPDSWCDTLTWMQKNTPEPLGNADAYYKIWERPANDGKFKYPDTAYGVLAPWDTGYWITRIGRRIPLSNPGREDLEKTKYASFFIAEDSAQAAKVLEDAGARYVIIDFDTALPLKFFSLAAASGFPKEKYYDVYYQKQGDTLYAVMLFYPEYYRTEIARLYNFDGKAVQESNVSVIAYEDAKDASGQPYKRITGSKTFKTLAEAQAYTSQQKTGKYKIGGMDPFVSPVTMGPLPDFQFEYGSRATQPTPTGGTAPAIKVFRYGR
jgi:dolichyl-phosphooligosaccharide-protein glycotransferase